MILILLILQFKRWEITKTKPNQTRLEKGKIGNVISVTKNNNIVMVKDINLTTKHVKGKKEIECGKIIHVSETILLIIN